MNNVVKILSPMLNTIIERNHFTVNFTCIEEIHSFKIQLYQVIDFQNEKLIFEETVTEITKANIQKFRIGPHSVVEDGYYKVIVSVNGDDFKYDETCFCVKPEHGWETIITYPDMSNSNTYNGRYDLSLDYKNENYDLLFLTFGNMNNTNGSLFRICQKTHLIKEKIVIPNDSIENCRFFFWGKRIFRLFVDKSILIHSTSIENPGVWEDFAGYHSEDVDKDYGMFINQHNQLVIFYKENLSVPIPIYKCIIFNLNGSFDQFEYKNELFKQDFLKLNTLNYLMSENLNDIVIITCSIPESLEPDDPNLKDVMIKFKVSKSGLSLYEEEVEQLNVFPIHLKNPVFIQTYNRIYWNNSSINEDTTEAWDKDTMKKCKVIPYGGTFNLKNRMDGRLYSIGASTKVPGMKYLKRYIE